MSESNKEIFRLLSVYGHIGMTMVLSMFIGLEMGWYLDNKVFNGKTAPYLTFIFLGFGIAAGFMNLWRLKKSLDNE